MKCRKMVGATTFILFSKPRNRLTFLRLLVWIISKPQLFLRWFSEIFKRFLRRSCSILRIFPFCTLSTALSLNFLEKLACLTLLNYLSPNPTLNSIQPTVPDRWFRDFFPADEESIDLTTQLETSINIEHAFSQMQGDLDQQRLLGERPLNDPLADIMVKEIQHQERWVFYVYVCNR